MPDPREPLINQFYVQLVAACDAIQTALLTAYPDEPAFHQQMKTEVEHFATHLTERALDIDEDRAYELSQLEDWFKL